MRAVVHSQENRHLAVRKLAIVGAGAIAKSHLRAIESTPNASLSAVVDPRLEAAESLTDNSKAVFSDIEELLENEKPDAVVLCTPPDSHARIATLALNAGVAVLCEKPVCLQLSEAYSLVEQACSNKTSLVMTSKYRFVEAVRHAQHLLTSKHLGKILECKIVFEGLYDATSHWRSDSTISGGGVIADNGPHVADIIRWLLGPIGEVEATIGSDSNQNLAVETDAELYFRTIDGQQAQARLSWSQAPTSEWYLTIRGDEGELRIGWQRSIRRTNTSDWQVFAGKYDKHGTMVEQMTRFCNNIHGQVPPQPDYDDLLSSVATVEACYESLRRRRPISLNLSGL